MKPDLAKPERLAQLCSEYASGDLDKLCDELNKLMPALTFNLAATRGNWHRLGGVVDADYAPVNRNIVRWAEQAADGDVDRLISEYVDKGWFATRLAGRTHYLVASCGDAPDAFVQIEIESLQEVLDRPLVERDWFPENLEEFLDPLDYPRLAPEPLGRPYYQFRRITPVEALLNDAYKENQALFNLKRFFEDWSASSASEHGPLCRHWALALREYTDSDGECRLSAKPFSTYCGESDSLAEAGDQHGASLANLIHGYDRKLGYPFAWYFNMLGSKSENFAVAEAVLRDQMGAYDYLPAKDLKVLRAWEQRPYGV